MEPEILSLVNRWRLDFQKIRGVHAKAGSIRDLFCICLTGRLHTSGLYYGELAEAQIKAAVWACEKSNHREVWMIAIQSILKTFYGRDVLSREDEIVTPTLKLLRKAEKKGFSSNFNDNLRKSIREFFGKVLLSFSPKDSDVAQVLVAAVCDYGYYDLFWEKSYGELDLRWSGSRVVVKELRKRYVQLYRSIGGRNQPGIEFFHAEISRNSILAIQLWQHLALGDGGSEEAISQLLKG